MLFSRYCSSLVSFPVTGAVCHSQLMISLIPFYSYSVLVRADRVAGQFGNLLKSFKIRPKFVMMLESCIHRCIIPTIKQNSANLLLAESSFECMVICLFSLNFASGTR